MREAKTRVNNKFRSQKIHLVSTCKDGQQFILFKIINCHDTPLVFPDNVHIGPSKMCNGVLWASSKQEKWVSWSSMYLHEKSEADPMHGV